MNYKSYGKYQIKNSLHKQFVKRVKSLQRK